MVTRLNTNSKTGSSNLPIEGKKHPRLRDYEAVLSTNFMLYIVLESRLKKERKKEKTPK